MAEIQDLIVIDASNTGRWPEGMQFSAVNDAGRADEGLLARWYKDTDSSVTASGSANAFAITSNRTIAALFNNLVMVFTANFSITGPTTLNLNGLGAKNIKRFNGNDLAAGDIISGQPVYVIYKSGPDQWFMASALAALTSNMFVDLSENATPGTPGTNIGRLSTFDDGGTTRLRMTDDAGNPQTFYPAATAAEMEATTANRLVSAALQHRHPGHPKAGGVFDGSAGSPAFAAGDYGMGAITDIGVGNWSVAFDTAFSSTNYWLTAFGRQGGASITGLVSANVTSAPKLAGSMTIYGCNSADGGVRDLPEVGLSFWGDQ